MIIPREFLSQMYGQFNGKRMAADKVTQSRFVDIFNKTVDDRLKHLTRSKNIFSQTVVDPKLAPNYNLTQIAQKVTGKRHGDAPEPIGPVYTTHLILRTYHEIFTFASRSAGVLRAGGPQMGNGFAMPLD